MSRFLIDRSSLAEKGDNPELDWCADSRLILITAHRRENLGTPMHHMFRAIRRVLEEHKDVKAIYPIHLNPVVRQTAEDVFGESSPGGKEERLHLIEPLDVVDFHNFMKRVYDTIKFPRISIKIPHFENGNSPL